jgi:hypothetical protein
MEEALLARLRATTAVTALVGTNNSRAAIDWIERPEALPALTLQDITAGKIYAHGGAVGLANPVVQIDCWGRTYGEAKALARVVIAEMETTEKVFGPAVDQSLILDFINQTYTVDAGILFDESFLVASRAMEPDDLGGGLKVYRQSLDFSVWFQPA